MNEEEAKTEIAKKMVCENNTGVIPDVCQKWLGSHESCVGCPDMQPKEKTPLAEVTDEENDKLLELVKNAKTFQRVVDIVLDVVDKKYNARPLNTTDFINLRVTAMNMANTPAKGGIPKSANHIIEDAEAIYKFLTGQAQSGILKLT